MQKIFSVISFLFIAAYSAAQDPVTVFNQRRDNLPNERIYLHFDRQAYAAGETMWFKAYLRTSGVPGAAGTTLYAELLNEKGEIVSAKKMGITKDNVISNQFEIPVNAAGGIYFVRAWTNYTPHLGLAYVYKKPVPVFNPGNTNTVAAASGKPAYSFQWFPEGGRIVNGVSNIIAFRAMDENMNPAAVSGVLLDDKGKDLGAFSTNQYGFGYFSFDPAKGTKYTAELSFPDKVIKKIELPDAVDAGIVLSVTDQDKQKNFTITVPEAYTTAPKQVQLLAIQENIIALNIKVDISSREAEGIISTDNLSEGLLRVMLFDENKNLLAQRATWVFAKNIKVNLLTTEKSVAPKGLNSWNVELPAGITGDFSVSVTDADKELVSESDNTISSSLMLQSGSAEPVTFARLNDEEMRDLVLLTGSRDDDSWDFFKKIKTPKKKDELHLPLKGKIYEQGNNKLLTEGQLNFLVKTKDSVGKEYSVPVMSDGSFELYSLAYEDTARIYYRWKGTKNEKPVPTDLEIEKETTDYSALLKNISPEIFITAKRKLLQNAAANDIAVSIMKNINTDKPATSLARAVTANPAKTEIKDVNQRYTSGMFKSTNNVKMLDLITERPTNVSGNILDYIAGRIGGLTIEKTGGRYTLRTGRSASTLEVLRGNTSGIVEGKCYLNESEVSADVIARISVEEIALVKYFPPGALMLPGVGMAGVLAVYQKKQEDMNTKDNRYFNSIVFPGYSPAAQFSLPDYASDDKRRNDNRVTLYWNPNHRLDETNKEINIRFYNSDRTKRFRLVLEGITDDGRMVSFEKIIE